LEKEIIKMEIGIQEKLLSDSEEIVMNAPKGTLYVRERKRGVSYYKVCKEKQNGRWKNVHQNINEQLHIIKALTDKKVAEKRIIKCKTNLKLLYGMLEKFESCDFDVILGTLPEKYQAVEKKLRDYLLEKWKTAPFSQCPKDPQKHIHETHIGELVRSKSEVIIANALYSCGIPFHYEERFPYLDENGRYFYPDFVIMLPDGRKLYWEHFGMLSKLSYCNHNAEKLYHYQMHGVHIGKNLIITQDDAKGSCNSAFIYRIIKDYILPYFK